MRSRYTGFLVVLAFGVLGWIVALIVQPDAPQPSKDEQTRTRRIAFADQAATPILIPRTQVPAPARDTAPGAGDVDGDGVEVRVSNARTGAPIAGASVALLQVAEHELVGGLALGSALEERTTDASGAVRVQLPTQVPDPGERPAFRLVVGARGFTSSTRSVPEGTTSVEVQLEAGLSIQGRAVDASGTPVPDLRLEARHWGHGHARSGERQSYSLCARSIAVATTDRNGRFEFPALHPGWYWVRPAQAGWTGRNEAPRPLLQAGVTDASVTVFPSRVARIAVVDEKTQKPIVGVVRTASLLPLEGATFQVATLLQRTRLHGEDGWRSIGGVTLRDGVLEGVVRFPTVKAMTRAARVLIQADGYQSVTAQVRLFDVNEGDAEVPADQIVMPRLEALAGEWTGSLHVTPRDSLEGMPAGIRGRELLILSETNTALRGANGVFSGVPAGSHTVVYMDGLRQSAPFEIEVVRDVVTQVSVDMPGGSLVSIDLKDADETQVHAPDSVRIEGVDASGEQVWRIVSPDEHDGRLLAHLPPGRYTATVRKQGYRLARVEFDASLMGSTKVTLQLEARVR